MKSLLSDAGPNETRQLIEARQIIGARKKKIFALYKSRKVCTWIMYVCIYYVRIRYVHVHAHTCTHSWTWKQRMFYANIRAFPCMYYHDSPSTSLCTWTMASPHFSFRAVSTPPALYLETLVSCRRESVDHCESHDKLRTTKLLSTVFGTSLFWEPLKNLKLTLNHYGNGSTLRGQHPGYFYW